MNLLQLIKMNKTQNIQQGLEDMERQSHTELKSNWGNDKVEGYALANHTNGLISAKNKKIRSKKKCK